MRYKIFKEAIKADEDYYANIASNNKGEYICLSLSEVRGWPVIDNKGNKMSYKIMTEEEATFHKLADDDNLSFVYVKSLYLNQ